MKMASASCSNVIKSGHAQWSAKRRITEHEFQGSDDYGDAGSSGPSELDRNTKARLIMLLECPVCNDIESLYSDIIRSNPIYSCRVGHILCSQCHSRVSICPICRSTDVNCRSVIIEQMANVILEETFMNCINERSGCNVREIGKLIKRHLVVCDHEQVKCPFDSCSWIGSRVSVFEHAALSMCADLNTFSIFQSFPLLHYQTRSIFDNVSTLSWKPVLLLYTEHHFVFLNVVRKAPGNWFIYLRSLAHNDIVKQLRFTIDLFEAVQNDSDSNQLSYFTETAKDKTSKFSFTGSLHEASKSFDEVAMSGQFLHLVDTQMRTLHRRETLFNYNITIALRRVDGGTEKFVQIYPLPPETNPSKRHAEDDLNGGHLKSVKSERVDDVDGVESPSNDSEDLGEEAEDDEDEDDDDDGTDFESEDDDYEGDGVEDGSYSDGSDS